MSMPPPPVTPAPGALPPKKTNWWLIGCGGCLGLIVVIAIAAGAIFFMAMKAVKSSDAYVLALKTTQDSPEVQEKLGTPITPATFASGAVSVTNNTGTAALVFSVTGPKGGGKVIYQATKQDGEWKPTQHIVTIDGSGEVIDLQKAAPPKEP